MPVTLLDEAGNSHPLGGSLELVDEPDLTIATGWAIKLEGLCRGEVCVPLGDRVVRAGTGKIDLPAWCGALGYVLAVDRQHEVAAILPATGQVVKPPTISPGDDQFRDFTRIDSARHHDALRRWVTTGEAPDTTGLQVTPRTADEQLGQAERRLGAWLHDRGHADAAIAHLARAVELAPWDWTVRRASIALRGDDPFLGEEFVAFWQEWDEAGRPGYTAMS